MRKINAIIASLTLAGLGQVVYQESQAATICEDGVCEVVFTHTDSVQTFEVPDTVTELEFEVYGAQGGSSGGRGGFVSGVITNLPETITVMVGGEGVRGANKDGGFNGGGFSGGRDGSPGSGGGASDLRFGTALADRVVVAGGGGGFGGPVGGSGGAGGGLSADDGSAGQGGAGAGGDQLSGGAGGRSNSGNTNGASGRLGVGGEGGYTFSGYGGGGGGAGYFGGGGGGADTDTCCLDAGGGGGGSSFADPNHTSSVTFQPGTRAGNGLIILRYQQLATVTDFSYEQVAPSSVEVTLSFDSVVESVDLDDFVITGCGFSELSSASTTHLLSLDDCLSTPSVEIPQQTMGANLNLPTTTLTLPMALDQTAPELVISSPDAIATRDFAIGLETDETGVFDFEGIVVTDCEFVSSTEGVVATLSFTECTEGDVGITLPVTLVSDSVGNQSLAEPKELVIGIDLTVPTLEFKETQIEQVEEPTVEMKSTTEVVFSEVSASFEQFIFEGDESCVVSTEQTEAGILLITNGCSSGEISWTLPAESLEDSVGNLGPIDSMTTQITIPEVVIQVPQPSPAPQPAPVAPPVPVIQPAPAPIAVVPAPSPEPEPALTPEPELAPEPEPEPEPVSVEEIPQEVEPETDQETTREPEVESDVANTLEIENRQNTEQLQENPQAQVENDNDEQPTPAVVEQPREPETVAVSNPELNQASESSEQQAVNPWAIAIAAFLVLGLLVGVVFLTKNNRARTID